MTETVPETAADVQAWPAARLLEAARVWARARYPDAILVSELSVGNWGSASLDLGIITGTEIIGIEIKGDGDSPTRLKLQACAYGRAATRMWLLPAPSLQQRIFAKHVPTGWGQLEMFEGRVRNARVYADEFEPDRLANAPLQLTECLWKDELRSVSDRLQLASSARLRVDELQTQIAEHRPMADIRREVVNQLRRREWRLRYDESRIDLPDRIPEDKANELPPMPLFASEKFLP